MRSFLRITWISSLLGGIASPQTTTRVSVDSAGAQADEESANVSFSADGRYVAFDSLASNLVPGDTNGFRDVFVHDLQTGETRRVSVDANGIAGNGHSTHPSIAGHGRYIAFQSSATNLVPGDTNGWTDIFVYDELVARATRVSVDSNGVQANGGSFEPMISPNSRYVVYTSSATNLAFDDTNGFDDVFVRDDFANSTYRVSVSSSGQQANFGASGGAVSDGPYVVFGSASTNLAGDTNNRWDVFVHELPFGSTNLVSVSSAGAQGDGDSRSGLAISATGRFIAFDSQASNLVSGDTNGAPFETDVFVRDRATNQTTRASVDSAGAQANGSSSVASISADGRFVAFSSLASNLVPGDTNAFRDIFVRDRELATTTRASVDSTGVEAGAESLSPSISGDARFVAFTSFATNLVPGDTNTDTDIFVRDRGAVPIARFCAGDHWPGLCPCSSGAPDHGCRSSVFAGGLLRGSGTPSVSADSFAMQVEDVTGSTSLFYQGDDLVSFAQIDDGITCLTGNLIRIGVKANAGSTSSYPQAGDLSVSLKGMVPPVGARRYYQCMYRNAAAYCTPATTNRTNGLIVNWSL